MVTKRTADRLDRVSYHAVGDLVSTHRDPSRNFSSFEVFDPVTVHFDEHEPIVFPAGSMVAYYSSRALYLACLNSHTHSVEVKKGGDATILSYDLTDPEVFERWIKNLLLVEAQKK